MLPVVISEELIQPFKFVGFDGSIHTGMSYGMELYSHGAWFSEVHRAKAFELAYEWSYQGKQVVITGSRNSGYTLWVGLRSWNQNLCQTVAA